MVRPPAGSASTGAALRRRGSALIAGLAIGAAALAGCGRVGFDPVGLDPGGADASAACVEAGHDEDGDGIDDACDTCPHLADPGQADRDADRVGDRCDPRPDLPGEHILFFDPFTELRADWSTRGVTPISDGESLFVDTRQRRTNFDLAITPALDRIEIGLRVGAGFAGARQFGLRGVDLPGWYYCELYDPDAAPKFGLTYTSGDGTYRALQSADLPGPIEHSAAIVRMNHSRPTIGCEVSWPELETLLESPTPGGLEATSINMAAVGVELWLDYFIVIRSD